ncbi:MAG: transposase, partial [Nitriliruptoraceae bacterium]
AVATMDTVTLIRSAIRGLLKAADAQLEAELRTVLSGSDDYASAGKPVCDWNDADARAVLIDQLAADGVALLGVLEGRQLQPAVVQAGELVATVIGQDLEQDEHGTFRIVRGVATDRVISTVDPDARHGRKSTSGKFDGYKGHVAIDPDSEIVTDAAAGPANAGDGPMTGRLTADLDRHDDGDQAGSGDQNHDRDGQQGPAVYGDAAYGSGDQLAELDARGIDAKVKTQPPARRNGKFSKGDFDIDLGADTVTCPAGHTTGIVRGADGSGVARFADKCRTCPLRERCTDAARGRQLNIHRHEALLARQRARGADPDWASDYRATRPKVERKLAHLVRRGRRARRRGLQRVDADWNLLAGAVNLARLAALGTHHTTGGWRTAPA